MRWLSRPTRRVSPAATRTPCAPRRCRPTLEALEDRDVPSVSVIQSNFNGTPIAAGSTVWFNSILRVSGVGSAPVTINVTDASVVSPQFSLDVPDAQITFSPSASTATTTFDAASNKWVSVVPSSLAGSPLGGVPLLGGLLGGLVSTNNSFLAGVAMAAPSGLPGGITPVTWSADFYADTPGLSVQWQWAAAAYSNFSDDPNALGVKPIDNSTASAYQNADKAGTPENFKSFVRAGARGNGGTNYTGSYSASKAVTPEVFVPASLSGSVYTDLNFNGVRDEGEPGIGGVTLYLTGTDDRGNAVNLAVSTNPDGSYSFTGLRAGTYQIFESQPQNYDDGSESVGTINGNSNGSVTENDAIGNITLGAGQNGVNYDFGELYAGS